MNLKNYHILHLKFCGPTNYRASKVKITSDRFKQSVTLNWDYQNGHSLADQVGGWLVKEGFELVGQGEVKDGMVLISSTFKRLK